LKTERSIAGLGFASSTLVEAGVLAPRRRPMLTGGLGAASFGVTILLGLS